MAARGMRRVFIHREGQMAIEEGKAAPAFTLPDQNGKPVSLKDFAGKVKMGVFGTSKLTGQRV